MRRALIALAAVLAVSTGIGVGNGGSIEVTYEHPDTINPTIITDTDQSGKFRVERIGPHAIKLVNFDASVSFVMSPKSGITQTTLTACNMGGFNDPSGPWPMLDVTWTHSDETTTGALLDVDQCSSCVSCKLEMLWEE